LDATYFPDLQRLGGRGPKFQYPECLIIFITILFVKLKVKSYAHIHRMAMQYWDQLAAGLNLEPISERQLRDRLNKICHNPRNPATFIFSYFLNFSQDLVISTEKMMNRAKGPQWYKN
jgi:hypothetical protein